jgi:hypothetical protein
MNIHSAITCIVTESDSQMVEIRAVVYIRTGTGTIRKTSWLTQCIYATSASVRCAHFSFSNQYYALMLER